MSSLWGEHFALWLTSVWTEPVKTTDAPHWIFFLPGQTYLWAFADFVAANSGTCTCGRQSNKSFREQMCQFEGMLIHYEATDGLPMHFLCF